MLPKFNAVDVWTWLLAVEQYYGYRVNMFMGVPTMYVKLIENYEKTYEKNDRMVEYVKAVCSQKIRQVYCLFTVTRLIIVQLIVVLD